MQESVEAMRRRQQTYPGLVQDGFGHGQQHDDDDCLMRRTEAFEPEGRRPDRYSIFKSRRVLFSAVSNGCMLRVILTMTLAPPQS